MRADFNQNAGHFPDNRLLLSRREFLSVGAVGSLGAFLLPDLTHAMVGDAEDSLVFRLCRDVDLMQLEARFIRFRQTNGILQPIGFGDSLVALRFPPQNLAEAIFEEKNDEKLEHENNPLPAGHTDGTQNEEGKNDPSSPVSCYLSGPSWMVFQVENSTRFPLNNIEQWFKILSSCNLKVPRGALPPNLRGKYQPVPPRSDETRLEIPFRLQISPEPDVRTIFSSNTQPSPATPFREMWQAALESRHPVKPAPPPPGTPNLPDELNPPKEVVLHSRAVWSPDYKPSGEPVFSLYYPGYQPLSLHALTRHRLVKQMGAGDGWIDAEHLILTALGADASFHYSSQKPVETIIREQLESKETDPGAELRLWKHRIVIGRDVYFAEAFFGFLFPFCHPAVYVEITKRKAAAKLNKPSASPPAGSQPPGQTPPPSVGFYLLKKRFILVQDPLKHFASSGSPVGRQMPLKQARILTLRSPDLADPGPLNAFWPVELGSNTAVSWEIEAVDESGRMAKSSHAELYFATNIVNGQSKYNQEPESKRTIRFPGSKIAFANEQAKDTGAALETQTITFKCDFIGDYPQVAEESLVLLSNPDHSLLSAIGKEIGKIQDNTIKNYFQAEVERIVKSSNGNVAGQRQAIESFLKNCEAKYQDAAKVIIGDWVQNALSEKIDAIGKVKDTAKKYCKDRIRSIVELNKGNVADQLRALEGMFKEIDALGKEGRQLGCDMFHPVMEAAQVVIPALKEVLPQTSQRTIELFDDYVAAGIDNVQNGVYARLKEVINTGDKLAESVKTGIAQPAAIIAGLSRDLGAVMADGEDKLKELARAAKDLTKGVEFASCIPDAKIFGVIPLRALIGTLQSGKLPQLNRIELPDKIERKLEMILPVKDNKFGILTISFKPENAARLYLLSRATIKLPAATELAKGQRPRPEFQLHGWLGRWDDHQKPASNGEADLREIILSEANAYAVALNLCDLIEVRFKSIRFDAIYSEGQEPSPKIDVKLSTVEFLGPLNFVQRLQDMFKGLGNFSIKPSSDYLSLGHEIEIPPLSFGAFNLWGIRLKNRLSLPLRSAPLQYDFALSSFKKPFELSVMGYAGRGFFSAGFKTNGERQLEGALEFGGSLAFNAGVASGGLYVMGGIYFKLTNEATTVAGYVRAGGSLDVLGLIHASVEFMLMLRYQNTARGGELYGICTVTVSIDLFLFSMDVNITMEKRIAGSGAPQQSKNGMRSSSSALPQKTTQETSEPEPPQGRPYIARKNSLPGQYQFDSARAWREQYWDHLAA